MGTYEFMQCISKQPGIFPVVIPPFKFIEVSIEMLCTDFMVSTCNRTLKETPDILNRVGVGVATHAFFVATIPMTYISSATTNKGFVYLYFASQEFGIQFCLGSGIWSEIS